MGILELWGRNKGGTEDCWPISVFSVESRCCCFFCCCWLQRDFWLTRTSPPPLSVTVFLIKLLCVVILPSLLFSSSLMWKLIHPGQKQAGFLIQQTLFPHLDLSGKEISKALSAIVISSYTNIPQPNIFKNLRSAVSMGVEFSDLRRA